MSALELTEIAVALLGLAFFVHVLMHRWWN
jgi:hypothetical protein